MYIVVAADQHPTYDEWVQAQGEQAARENGLTLGEYLGREDALGEVPADVRCHVFAAE